MVPAEDSKIKTLLFRLANMGDFQNKYVQHSINRGYFLLFTYEMMHEKISLDHRDITDTPDTILLTQKHIQNRHNETLGNIVRLWKPKVKNPTENATQMKVHSFFSSLTYIDRT
jgi:hypothetical protein